MPIFNSHPVLHGRGVKKCGNMGFLLCSSPMAELAGIFWGWGAFPGQECILSPRSAFQGSHAWLAACPSCFSMHCLLNWPVPSPLPPHFPGERGYVCPCASEAGTTPLCEAKVTVVAQASEAFSVPFGKLLVRETILVYFGSETSGNIT